MTMTHSDEEGTFTHLAEGKARMVDVGGKEVTQRYAVAEGDVLMEQTTLEQLRDNELAKGNVLQVARIAGIMGAKKTSELVPLCHQLALTSVELDFELIEAAENHEQARVRIEARVQTSGRTGVEMEALTAVSTAALTIYDMCKAVDRAMEFSGVRLQEKAGGRTGHWVRQEGVDQHE
jgi:cyclic pyranopterin phosphate synthase